MIERELRDVIELLKGQLSKAILEQNFALAKLRTAEDRIKELEAEKTKK